MGRYSDRNLEYPIVNYSIVAHMRDETREQIISRKGIKAVFLCYDEEKIERYLMPMLFKV